MKRALRPSDNGWHPPIHIPFRVCPHCENVFYFSTEPLGPEGCHCQHDPADGPQQGDPITLFGKPEHRYGEYISGHRVVVHGPDIFSTDKLHICLSAMVPYRGANGRVDISGGPFLGGIDPSIMRYAGRKSVSFWKWSAAGPGEGNGEYYTLSLPLWVMDIDAMDASNRQSWTELEVRWIQMP